MSHNKPGPMVDVLREILTDKELTHDELEDELQSRKQAAIRHLLFIGELERDYEIREKAQCTVTVSRSQGRASE